MSGWVEIKASHEDCAARLRALRDKLPQCSAQLLKEHATITLRTAIKLDDKLTLMHAANKGTTAKSVREAAVKRSIFRTMRPLYDIKFDRSPKMRATIKRLAAVNDFEALDVIISRFKLSQRNRYRGVFFSSRFHRDNINRRDGRTMKTGFYVPNPAQVQSLEAYIKLIQARVGSKFAGFLPALNALGATRIAGYIKRHAAGAKGSVTMDLSGPVQQILVRNTGNVDRKLQDRVRASLKLRSVVLARQFKRLVKGEATNLGFAVFDKGEVKTLAQWKALKESKEAIQAPIGE